MQLIPGSVHKAFFGSLTVGSETLKTMQVPFDDPMQLVASLTLDQAMLLPWNAIAPEHLESVATLQLLLANIAVATFCDICAYIRDSKLFRNLDKFVFFASAAALSNADWTLSSCALRLVAS
jgi:hypothetical protein